MLCEKDELYEEYKRKAEKHEKRIKIAIEVVSMVVSIGMSVITAIIVVLLCTS